MTFSEMRRAYTHQYEWYLGMACRVNKKYGYGLVALDGDVRRAKQSARDKVKNDIWFAKRIAAVRA